ncbi:hypothetical protein LSTR_LSTR013017 [Laodelphax striatellus]|uniref:Uncharacterized protein n=1 Tax=Laodelphax striatellus TaxID=195883 RepID=A0A482WFC7_LAOST|nr:hypothetical protein LSTR_LSTR013017 [Laodelphax striatellus]
MENLSAKLICVYIGAGRQTTLCEKRPHQPRGNKQTLMRQRPGSEDAGSITSANFNPENLRQLSSTRLEPEVVPDRSASTYTVTYHCQSTTQTLARELSPLTSN